MNLIYKIIYNDCTKNSIFKWIRDDYVWLPKNKSLFFAKTNYWLPIWNLTSQLFSNIYLSDFDKYIKRESSPDSTGSGLFYWRYVDDFIIVHHDKNFLISMIEKTRNYLNHNLWLTLHPDKIYLQHYKNGVLFLWCYIKPYRLYIRKRTIGYLYTKIQKLNTKLKNNDIITKNDFHKYILSPINSYLGFIKNTSSFKVKIKILKKLDKWLLNFLYLDNKFNKIILKH